MHDAVRGPVAASLKSRNPAQYQAYRRTARGSCATNTSRLRDLTTGVAPATYYLLENENLREGFSPPLRSLFPSNPPAPTTGHPFRQSFKNSTDRNRVKRCKNGGATIPTRFFVVRDEIEECKVSTRQSWYRRFTK